MKVKILGISGSPRHGNTEILVKEALASAKELSDVETDYYALAGKNINACTACARCSGAEATPENPCPRYPDDVVVLVKKMIESDGLIVGTPVYVGGVTAQLKAVFDRSINMTEFGPLGPVGARNKVVGAVVSAWDREGGHCMTILDIWKWAILQDMVIVGTGPERIDSVSYWGGCAIQAYHGDKPEPFWDAVCTPEELTAVKYDKLGLQSCRRIGKRVAEMTKVVKAGFGTLPREQTYWPYGPAGGFLGPDGKPYEHL